MGITYTVDHERRRVLARVEGLLTFADLSAYVDAGERERAPGYCELFDACGVTAADLTGMQVQAMVWRAVQAHRKTPLGSTAIVATQPVVFGLARMYATLCEWAGNSVAVFRTVEEAERWLDSHPNGSPVT
jgi:hypothetical protein